MVHSKINCGSICCMTLPAIYEFINDEKDSLHVVQQIALLDITPAYGNYRQIIIIIEKVWQSKVRKRMNNVDILEEGVDGVIESIQHTNQHQLHGEGGRGEGI